MGMSQYELEWWVVSNDLESRYLRESPPLRSKLLVDDCQPSVSHESKWAGWMRRKRDCVDNIG